MSPVLARTGPAAALWVATAMAALATWKAYTVAYDAEAGSRAGAEPGIAGVVLALPFAVLVVVELFVAMGLGLYDRWSTRVAFVAVAAVAALLCWLVTWAARPSAPASDDGLVALAAGLLTAPLVVAAAFLAAGRRTA